jgi:hypothetical protein
MKTSNFLFLSLFFLSCLKKDQKNTDVIKLDKIYVSYYGLRGNYDIDSVKVIWVDSSYLNKIDSITVYLKESGRFTPQNLLPRDGVNFVNNVSNGANKPFWWADPLDNNLALPLDSVKKYLKNYVKEYNTFTIHSKSGYKKTIKLDDTRVIILKELYGGHDVVN